MSGLVGGKKRNMKITIDMTESEQKNILNILNKYLDYNAYLMKEHPEYRENIKVQTELLTKIISNIEKK